MAFPEKKMVEFDGTVISTSDEVDVSQLMEKGYDFLRDGAATFVGNLEGSVTGRNWTVIASLAASAQGAIPAQYNLVRVKVGTGGVHGATTALYVAGKVV